MKKLLISFLLIFIIITCLLTFLTHYNLILTGKATTEIKSYSRVICNETNFCQTYLIECEKNILKNMTPIINASLQYDLEWKNPRENLSYNLCSR